MLSPPLIERRKAGRSDALFRLESIVPVTTTPLPRVRYVLRNVGRHPAILTGIGISVKHLVQYASASMPPAIKLEPLDALDIVLEQDPEFEFGLVAPIVIEPGGLASIECRFAVRSGDGGYLHPATDGLRRVVVEFITSDNQALRSPSVPLFTLGLRDGGTRSYDDSWPTVGSDGAAEAGATSADAATD
jgi:hypothetical protein